MVSNRVMTTKELAEYIKLNEKTIIKMAQNREVPGVKVGSQWRFHLDSIDKYLQGDIISESNEKLDLIIGTGINIVPLSRLIDVNLMNLDFTSNKAEDVLVELAKIAVDAGLTNSGKKLLSELKKREKLLSTSVHKSVAIPHPRHPDMGIFNKPNIVLVRSVKGIDFHSPEKEKTHLFFMICAPNEFSHIRLLAKVSKLLNMSKSIDQIIKAKKSEDVIKVFMEFDRENFIKNGS